MVAPLVAALVGGLGSSIGTAALMSWAGSEGKKEQATTDIDYHPVVHSPYETFSPEIQYSPQYGYSYQGGDIIISSPGATTKKEAEVEQESTPYQYGTWTLPQTYTDTETTGTNMTHIAIIAAVALVAYGLVSKK